MTPTMHAAWQIAPAPALFITTLSHGGVGPFMLNPAAQRWTRSARWQHATWHALAQQVAATRPHADPPAGWQGQDQEQGVAWSAVCVDGGMLAWLEEAAPRMAAADDLPALRAQLSCYIDRLDMAQELGRFGLWERDLTSGEGWWDEHTARFFGQSTGETRGDFASAAVAVHPDDRALVRRVYAQSLAQPGDHEVHYRLLQPGEALVPVHARWRVLAGADGQACRVIGIVFDETAHLEDMERYQRSVKHLSMAGGLVGIDVWRLDLATQCVQLDGFGQSMLGVRFDPRGVPVDDLRQAIHPDDRPAVVRAAEQALGADAPVDVRARYLDSSGHYREFLTRRVAQRDERGRPVALLGVSVDLSPQAHERARTAAFAARMDLVAEATGIGVWSRNLDTGAREWNGHMRHIFGVSDDDASPGLRLYMLKRVIDEDRHKVEQMTVRVAELATRARARRAAGGAQAREASDDVVEVECRIRAAGGDLRWLVMRAQMLWVGDELLVHGVVIDVSEFRSAQVELQMARSRVELAAQAAGLGTWEYEFDPPRCHWDAQMFHLRGLLPDDPRPIQGLIRSLSPPGDDPLLMDFSLAEAQRKKGPYTNEFRVRWPDGTVHWLASRGTTLLDAEGKVTRVVGINWDVTEQKLAEQMVRDKLMAEEASRAKSEFLARMSHELRTPLNAVLGFADLLSHAPPERIGESERAKAELICSAGRHLLALIDDVLDLARSDASRQPMAREPVSLDAVLGDVMRWVQVEARTATVSVKAQASGLWALADARGLRQVFSNLLSNGIKYNRPGGQVQVLAAVAASAPERPAVPWAGQAAPCADDAAWVVVRVRDSGRGLSPEQLGHVFEPFNRLGAEAGDIQGTGIGLAIVRQLVLGMGGGIDVSSQAGVGTEFRFWLPLGQAPLAAETRPEAMVDSAEPVEAAGLPRCTAIYIEDNPVNLLLVRELFNCRPAWTLHTATTGTEGVSETLRLRPQLALVDMQLPDIDGLQVLQRLKAEPTLSQLRCIALSANAMPVDVQRAREAGFDDYWTKPIDFQAFLAALDGLALVGEPAGSCEAAGG